MIVTFLTELNFFCSPFLRWPSFGDSPLPVLQLSRAPTSLASFGWVSPMPREFWQTTLCPRYFSTSLTVGDWGGPKLWGLRSQSVHAWLEGVSSPFSNGSLGEGKYFWSCMCISNRTSWRLLRAPSPFQRASIYPVSQATTARPGRLLAGVALFKKDFLYKPLFCPDNKVATLVAMLTSKMLCCPKKKNKHPRKRHFLRIL